MLRVFFGGVCALALTMGIARFAYTPLLPVMQEETFLGVASGGWLATIHYIGYFIGVIAGLRTEKIRSREIFYFWGLFLTIISTFMMGVSDNFFLWSAARLVAGFCGAAGIIIGAGLIMQWLAENTDKPVQMGKYFAGAGVGIVISAVGAIFFNKVNLSWNHQWFAYGVISILLFIPAWLLRPDNKVNINTKNLRKNIDKKKLDKPPKGLYKLLLMYFFSGFGFVVSATFTVAIVKVNLNNLESATYIWLLVGLASVPSVLFWDFIENKFGMLCALCCALLLHSISLLITAFVSDSLIFLLFSALLFGISHLGVVSLTMTLAGRESPNNPGKEMARLTIAFALALIIGPSIAGIISEFQGSYFSSLILSASMLISGIILLLLRNQELR